MRFFRFLAFSLYLFFLLSIPLGVFWEWKGWLAGMVVWLAGILYLGFRAKESLLTSGPAPAAGCRSWTGRAPGAPTG